MGGTVTSPSRSSPTHISPPSEPKTRTPRHHKRGLWRNRRAPTACWHSRESEGSRGTDGLRSAQASVPIGLLAATSAARRSASLVGVASPPSSRSQALPLQAARGTSGMNYNCSTRDCPKTLDKPEKGPYEQV